MKEIEHRKQLFYVWINGCIKRTNHLYITANKSMYKMKNKCVWEEIIIMRA